MTTFCPEGRLLHTPENDVSESGLARAQAAGRTLEAVPSLCDEHHDLHFSLGPVAAVLPRDEAEFSPCGAPVRDVTVLSRVGRPTCFRVLSMDDGRAVLSRRAAQEAVWDHFAHAARPGDILPATVTHTAHFGAFCDVGCGVTALLPVSRMSISRVAHSADRLSPGQEIFCALLAADQDAGRITLTMRELLGTWEENAARFCAGQTVTGVVRAVQPFGVFIELAPNLCGLAEPDARLDVGDACAVYIKSIQPDRQKIKLAVVHVLDQLELPPQRLPFIRTGGRLDSWAYRPAGPLTIF